MFNERGDHPWINIRLDAETTMLLKHLARGAPSQMCFLKQCAAAKEQLDSGEDASVYEQIADHIGMVRIDILTARQHKRQCLDALRKKRAGIDARW